MEIKRSSFTGKLGFVLAAAGSAVGLGNIWRFPYLAAQYGGGIFLLTYVILSVTFGFSLMMAEIAIGRKTGKSAIEAFGVLDKRFKFVGILAAIIPMIILPYYSVIGGWVFRYLLSFMMIPVSDMATDGYFDNYIGSSPLEPTLCFVIFIVVTALIVLLGVEKGIEKVGKVMMPALIVLTAFIAVYAIISMNAWEGVKYYILPNFTDFTPIKAVKTVVAAMGQLFYSMSLAMGIMITFGSYMKKDINIEKSAKQIELFDTGVAFLAGLMIIPAVFVFNSDKLGAYGPGLMFEILPQIFEAMPAGRFIGIAFFLMVLLAALTSSISLMETVVAVFMDKFKVTRKTGCLIVLGLSVLLGLPSVFGSNLWADFKIIGMDLLTFFDFLSNNVLMPIVAFITCIFVGFVLKPRVVIDEVTSEGNKFKWQKIFSVMIRFVAPVCILIILVSSVLSVLAEMPWAKETWLEYFKI